MSKTQSYHVSGPKSREFLGGPSTRNPAGLTSRANVAFKTPDGRKVLIVHNGAATPQTFNIGYKGKMASATLNPGSVATYVWQ